MSTQFRTALTPSEAKAAADRQDAWSGHAWMVIPLEASRVKHDGLQREFLKDDPVVTSDLDLIEQVRYDGHLFIKRNPYLPQSETDYDAMLADRAQAIEESGFEQTVSKDELLSSYNAAQSENEELKRKLEEMEAENAKLKEKSAAPKSGKKSADTEAGKENEASKEPSKDAPTGAAPEAPKV